MSFLNTQLTKKHDIQLLQIRKKIMKYVIFKYTINKNMISQLFL